MIISKIKDICKAAKRIIITRTECVQWISDGYSTYPLYNVPELSRENVFAIFDIPEDKQSGFQFDERECLGDGILLSDEDDGERQLTLSQIEIKAYGMTLAAIKGDSGVIFINKRYLAPFADFENGVQLYERRGRSGKPYIAVKDGMFLYGLILPAPIDMSVLGEELMEIGRLARIRAESGNGCE